MQAYATHSAEARLERFLRDARTTTVFVSTLASLRGVRGLSQTRLAAIRRGKALEHDAAKLLHELLDSLEGLRDKLKPVPVSFFNAVEIDNLLKLREHDQLSIFVVSPKEEQVTEQTV